MLNTLICQENSLSNEQISSIVETLGTNQVNIIQMKISLFLFFIHEQTLTTFDLKYPKKTVLVQRLRSPPRSEMGCFPNWSREGRKPIRCSFGDNRFDFPVDATD